MDQFPGKAPHFITSDHHFHRDMPVALRIRDYSENSDLLHSHEFHELVLVLGGIGVYIVRYIEHGAEWATFAANSSVYTSGVLSTGTLTDRSGVVLATANGGSRSYADDAAVRTACYQAVGDYTGNVGTGALKAFSKQLSGYNPITGTYATDGHTVALTLDSSLCVTAYEALAGRKGAVLVSNYKTGEILCMVSAPSFDPLSPPEDIETNAAYSGAYVNRFLSSAMTPGSIFKCVTLTAALEQIDDLSERTWTCTGSVQIGADTVTCPSAHGELDIESAFAKSCNCVFGQLATELGAETMEKYTKKAGLTARYDVDGIQTAAGSFVFDDAEQNDLAWAGVGQGQDTVNPCAMMVYMGAVANGGRAAVPQLIQSVKTPAGLPTSFSFSKTTGRLIEKDTAAALADMMANNVSVIYGTKRFPGMDICAKSGTAEVGDGKAAHGWFVGFLNDEEHPYAFVCLVENGGSGLGAAGSVINTVLQAAVAK